MATVRDFEAALDSGPHMIGKGKVQRYLKAVPLWLPSYCCCLDLYEKQASLVGSIDLENAA